MNAVEHPSALRDFEVNLEEVDLLLALAGSDDLADGADRARDNTLRRAAIVLLVAHFESFLKAVVTEFIDDLCSASPRIDALDEKLRYAATRSRLDKLIEAGDTQARDAHLKKLDRVARLWQGDRTLEGDQLDAKVWSRMITSAKPDVVEHCFAALGVERSCGGHVYVGEGEESIPVGIDSTLSDIVRFRDSIAHGRAGAVPTGVDSTRYLSFIRALAEHLHRLLNAERARIGVEVRKRSALTALIEVPRSCSPKFPRSRGQVSAGSCRWWRGGVRRLRRGGCGAGRRLRRG